jgi:AraC-like DNA-binding protein
MTNRRTSAPLARYALFRSTDLDEARERVAQVFCPHRLETVAETNRFDARHHHLRGDQLTLNYIEYGARTLIAPGALEHFYLLQIPLTGAAEIQNGSDRYISTPSQAAVLNPHLPTRMVWEEGTRQVLVQIRRDALEAHLEAEFGGSTGGPPTFRGPLNLTEGQGAALRRLVLWLVAEADAGRSLIGAGLMSRQMELAILAGLIETQRHGLGPQHAQSYVTPGPRHLRLAESFIEGHLDQAITIVEVARAAGTSVRGLQLLFRHYRGTTPLAFWREARLARAHADLSAATPGTTVTEVALRWGFDHFGRFSQLYRSRYGLCPRDTLRAAALQGRRAGRPANA